MTHQSRCTRLGWPRRSPRCMCRRHPGPRPQYLGPRRRRTLPPALVVRRSLILHRFQSSSPPKHLTLTSRLTEHSPFVALMICQPHSESRPEPIGLVVENSPSPRGCKQFIVETYDPALYLRVGGDSWRGTAGGLARSEISKKRVRWIGRTPWQSNLLEWQAPRGQHRSAQGRSLTRVLDRRRVVVTRRDAIVHEQGLGSARRRQVGCDHPLLALRRASSGRLRERHRSVALEWCCLGQARTMWRISRDPLKMLQGNLAWRPAAPGEGRPRHAPERI